MGARSLPPSLLGVAMLLLGGIMIMRPEWLV